MGLRTFGRRQLLKLIHRRPFSVRHIGPVVSFTFDDFPRSAYTAGGAILKDFGARGTFYTAIGLMNSSTAVGDQFGLDDLHSVVADGHELASHTYHHLSSQTTSTQEFLEDVRAGCAALHDIPELTVSDNFAYPFGAVTAATKQAVGEEMLSCRSTFGGVNGPQADLNLLRANALYGDTEQLGFVRHLLKENERLKGWLIFYTHDVHKTPSRYGCTPRLLEAAVSLAAQQSMRILTVHSVVAAAVAQTNATAPNRGTVLTR